MSLLLNLKCISLVGLTLFGNLSSGIEIIKDRLKILLLILDKLSELIKFFSH